MKKYNCHKPGYILMMIVMIFAFVSCQDEYSLSNDYKLESTDVEVLSFISDPMHRYNVPTRTSDAKDDKEKKIHSINIFFFNEDGSYLEGKYLTGNPNAPDNGGYYKTGDGVSLLKVAPDHMPENKNITVFAVANVGDLFSEEYDSNGRPKIISDMIAQNPSLTPKAALESIVLKPDWTNGVELGLPETGMPMSGSKNIQFRGNNVTPSDERIIELKALMARVDVNLQILSDNGNAEYPSFLLTGWRVINIPNCGAIAQTPDGSQTGEGWTDWVTDTELYTGGALFTNGETYKNVCTFYMYENMQDAEWKIDDGEKWQVERIDGITDITQLEAALYPEKISDSQKQRYKPYLANSNATAIELHGQYHTYNDQGTSNSLYNVKYTLYLGGNHTNNFQIKRNHQYKNNITIKGLLGVGSSDGEFTFDARVNVENDQNDFYVSILRELKHDAHFNITPMDVYMFREAEGHSVRMEVELSEVDADGNPTETHPSWIRMERISADDMEEGTVDKTGGLTPYNKDTNTGTHIATGTPWTAGNGKRAFFTTDLMSQLATKVTLTKSRDRIYFYFDEYLDKYSEVPLTDPRQAIVVMKYYEDDETEPSGEKTVLLAQYPFLRVQVYGRKNDVSEKTFIYDDDSQYGDGVIYMEQIEEYLEHYDPLDKFNTGLIYDGLSWGETRVLNNLGTKSQLNWKKIIIWWYKEYPNITSEENFVWGDFYTRQIIEAYEQSIMTLNDKPRSAVEYCWNRNKRNSEGVVVDGTEKYFLPGIRQMEDALTTYYNSFLEFQGNYYWSSATAKNDSQGAYARATKANSDGTYVSSTSLGDGGYKLRSEECRIRVFRKDLKPQ